MAANIDRERAVEIFMKIIISHSFSGSWMRWRNLDQVEFLLCLNY